MGTWRMKHDQGISKTLFPFVYCDKLTRSLHTFRKCNVQQCIQLKTNLV